MLLVLLFVCFAYIKFCPFSLPFGARGWLRLVLVALPGLFFLLCCWKRLCLENEDGEYYVMILLRFMVN